jgi:integrase
MSVHKRSDTGKWQARIKGSDGIRRGQSFRTKADAERWEREQIRMAEQGRLPPVMSGRESVASVGDKWITTLDLAVYKPSTINGYVGLWKRIVRPRWGSVPLTNIQPADVREWFLTMTSESSDPSKKQLSHSRRKQSHQVLAMILDQAIREGTLITNPARWDAVGKVALSRGLKPKEHRYLNPENLLELVNACKEYGPFVYFLATTGVRFGEARSLMVGDIEVASNKLRISKSITEINGHLVTGTPKNGESRTLVLPKTTLAKIIPLLDGKSSQDLVFTGPKGGPIRQANFRRRVWLPLLKATGNEGLRVHDLRHTAASLAIKSGANVKVVQNMLGHKSAQMTLDRYAGLFESDQVDVAKRMDKLFADTDCHENATKASRITLSYVIENPKPFANKGKDLVAPTGFEPATHGLGNRRSIP